MKDIHTPEVAATTPATLPGPQGIGMAVAFDWGLATQVLLTPLIPIFFPYANAPKLPGLNSTLASLLFFIIALLVACGLVYFGEMVRRGRKWTRMIQVVANALLFLGGLFSLVNLVHSIQAGNFWPVLTEIILLIFSPLIAWRLSRPSTALWFKTVSVAEASRRHGGTWILFIALWGIVGGILQTLATMK